MCDCPELSDSKSPGCPTGPKSDHGASTTSPTSLLESEWDVEQSFRAGGTSFGLVERLKGLNRHESVPKTTVSTRDDSEKSIRFAFGLI